MISVFSMFIVSGKGAALVKKTSTFAKPVRARLGAGELQSVPEKSTRESPCERF
jgi:hypothetical protein